MWLPLEDRPEEIVKRVRTLETQVDQLIVGVPLLQARCGALEKELQTLRDWIRAGGSGEED